MKPHYTVADFVIVETVDGNECGYCRQCKADMQRFASDGILRHYHSHRTYRTLKTRQYTVTKTGDDTYPPPANCPHQSCPEYRPACQLGICKLEIIKAGDW